MLLDRIDNILIQRKCDIVKNVGCQKQNLSILLPMESTMNLITAEGIQ